MPAKQAFASVSADLPAGGAPAARRAHWLLLAATAVLLAGYHRVLLDYFNYARSNDLYSYTLLIPFVSVYLAWIHPCPAGTPRRRAVAPALIPLGIGILLLLGRYLLPTLGTSLSAEDQFALVIGSAVCLFAAAVVSTQGVQVARHHAFALGFLFFLAPMPTFLHDGLNRLLQHLSADVSYLFIQAAQVSVFRDGLFLQLPGITLEVAEECSGIRSTIVLFITSTVASFLFLRRPLHRFLVVGVVLPLAILRNGLRIFTIALLCVHVGPHMIDSPVHHRGGPIFFAISLVPLLAWLWWLRRRERRASPAVNSGSPPAQPSSQP